MRKEYERLFEQLSTPYRFGKPVLEPTGKEGDFDSRVVDCPHIFYHQDKWWMIYLGWDGEGYRIGLACSNNLIDWQREGLILDWGKQGEFDCFGAGGGVILRAGNELTEKEFFMPRKVDDKYWMVYCGFPEKGYEQGTARLGLAYSDDLMHWKRYDKNPILSPEESWEKSDIYRPYIFKEKDSFYLFYNAHKSPKDFRPWIEQIGFATSSAIYPWKKFEGNPVIRVREEGKNKFDVQGDPYIFKFEGVWVMFYWAWKSDEEKPFNQGHLLLAFSDDLRSWETYAQPILVAGPPGSIDECSVEKPCVVWHQGILYCFYQAIQEKKVDNPYIGVDGRYRTIALATSKPL